MRYELLQKPDFGMIKVTFEQSGEQLLAESSAMVAKDTPIQIKTQLQGGLAAAAKRKFLGGESLFQNTFTATAPDSPAVTAQLVACEEVDDRAIDELHFAQLEDRCDLLGLCGERCAAQRQRADCKQEKCEAPVVRHG